MEKLNAALKKLIRDAKRTGSVTLAEINAILPADAASPEQIEAVMGQIEEAGLDITESKETSGKKSAFGLLKRELGIIVSKILFLIGALIGVIVYYPTRKR